MTAPEAKFLFEYLLPQLVSEQAITHKLIAAVPTGHDDYKPHPRSMSAYELARHIGVCELWFVDAVLCGRFFDNVVPPLSGTCADLAAWYALESSARIPMLRALPPNDLIRRVDYLGLRNDSAVAYLNIAIRHTVHHRGQLSTYLRAMGAAVPAIYVESADEPDLPEPPAF